MAPSFVLDGRGAIHAPGRREGAREAMIRDPVRYAAERLPRYTSYPTAAEFHGGVGAAEHGAWLAGVHGDETISLYVHVPFCTELCTYCGCATTVVRNYRPVEQFVETLLDEIGLVASALPQRIRVGHLHWGGGTPTALNPADMELIDAALKARFAFERDAEIAVEVDPRRLTADHAAAFRRMGVTRASIGVQDFDPRVQAAIGRIQSFAETRDAVDLLRAAAVSGINLDLVYGLPHQTTASFLETVEAALALDPDRLALFGYAHVPWMRPRQQLIPEEALPGSAARLECATAAAGVLVAAGHVPIGIDHFAKLDDPLARALASGRLRRNFQGYTTDAAPTLVALGPSGVSSFRDGFAQNHATVPPWRAAIAEGRLATARGIALDDELRLEGRVIERLMCDLSVDLAAVAVESRRCPSRFAAALPALDRLAADGLLGRRGWRITVPAEARPFLRHVAAVFDAHRRGGRLRHAAAV